MLGNPPPVFREFPVRASRDPLGALEEARGRGRIVRTWVPAHVWLVFDPEGVGQVLAAKSRSFRKGIVERNSLRFMGNGLLLSEGDFWRRQRRLEQPAFHRQRIAEYVRTMSRCTREMLDGWRDGDVVDVQREMSALTLRIVNIVMFGADVREVSGEVARALVPIGERLEGPGRNFYPVPETIPTPTNLRYRRSMKVLDEIIHRIIAQRRKERQEGDLLDMLLEARDEQSGEGMNDRQVRDEVITIFAAGHETTAVALGWCFHLLAHHPEVDERLAAEARDALGDREPGAEDVAGLRYASAVFREAMRIYPPIYAFSREAVEDVEVCGYTLPEGTEVLVSQWVNHRDPEFFEDPLAFRPGRWLDGSTDGIPRYAYFPFGGGPRQCIGKPFAETEGPLILASIARRYRLRYLDPHEEVTLRPTVTLRPAHRGGRKRGLPPMVLEER